MKDVARNTVRCQQLQAEAKILRANSAAWLQHRRCNDRDDDDKYVGRHETQLTAIGSVLCEALDGLDQHLCKLQPQLDVEELYGAAREYGEALVWLQRFWEFFKEKFDQRDDAALGPVLRAADEVVWSCWREVYLQARQFDPALKQGPAPLCFVAAEYSPAAVQSDRPPSSLMLTADVAFLTSFAQSLPVPLLRLPPWCVAAPWWLIYIAHEVGHHVQRELKLITWFADAVGSAVKKVPGITPDDAESWKRWSPEIFADIFSVALLGPWAVAGILEVELAPRGQMATRKREYPAPAIRLALMDSAAASLAKTLGETWMQPLAGLDVVSIAKSEPETARDCAAVATVVETALGPLRPPLGSLQQLCALKPGVFAEKTGKIAVWASQLRGADVVAARDLDSARQVAAASLQAWQWVVSNDGAMAGGREGLATRVSDVLRASAQEGTRAKLAADIPVVGKGSELLGSLLRRSRQTERIIDPVGQPVAETGGEI